jgi:hypothetical protein
MSGRPALPCRSSMERKLRGLADFRAISLVDPAQLTDGCQPCAGGGNVFHPRPLSWLGHPSPEVIKPPKASGDQSPGPAVVATGRGANLGMVAWARCRAQEESHARAPSRVRITVTGRTAPPHDDRARPLIGRAFTYSMFETRARFILSKPGAFSAMPHAPALTSVP